MKPYKYYILFLLITGCAKSHVHKTPNGYKITQSKKFQFNRDFRLPDSSLLNINKLYFSTCNNENHFFKFYLDGRVSNGSINKHSDGHSDTLWLCGYYSLSKSDIRIELSAVVSNGMITGDEWGVIVILGNIVGDTLKFIKDQWYGKGKNLGDYTTKNQAGQSCWFVKSGKSYNLKPPDW